VCVQCLIRSVREIRYPVCEGHRKFLTCDEVRSARSYAAILQYAPNSQIIRETTARFIRGV